MKKFPITKFYFNLFVLCACFLFGFVIFWCWVVAQSPDESSIFVDIAPIAFTLPMRFVSLSPAEKLLLIAAGA